MPRKPVVGVIFGRLFTFSPPTRASQLSEQTAIDDRPKPMPSPLNYPAYSRAILDFFLVLKLSIFGSKQRTISGMNNKQNAKYDDNSTINFSDGSEVCSLETRKSQGLLFSCNSNQLITWAHKCHSLSFARPLIQNSIL